MHLWSFWPLHWPFTRVLVFRLYFFLLPLAAFSCSCRLLSSWISLLTSCMILHVFLLLLLLPLASSLLVLACCSCRWISSWLPVTILLPVHSPPLAWCFLRALSLPSCFLALLSPSISCPLFSDALPLLLAGSADSCHCHLLWKLAGRIASRHYWRTSFARFMALRSSQCTPFGPIMNNLHWCAHSVHWCAHSLHLCFGTFWNRIRGDGGRPVCLYRIRHDMCTVPLVCLAFVLIEPGVPDRVWDILRMPGDPQYAQYRYSMIHHGDPRRTFGPLDTLETLERTRVFKACAFCLP